VSAARGGKFVHGFSAGAASSGMSSFASQVLNVGPTAMVVVGGLSGGVAAHFSGGSFTQ
jgi:hypothetical protein